MKTIGEKIKTVRNQLALSQEDFAYQIEVSTSTVSKAEVELQKPSKGLIKKICKKFGISQDYFYGNSDLKIGNTNLIEVKNSENPWKDEAYSLLKAELESWKNIAMQLAGGKLGKLNALVYAGAIKKAQARAIN